MVGKKPKTYFTAECSDIVDVVEFCPYEWASHLLAIATANAKRVIVASCKFPVENPELEDLDFQLIQSFHHETRITAFSWSPSTSLLGAPRVIRFCTADADNKIHLFFSDLETDSQDTLGEHRDYVNAIAIHPDHGNHVASVSDDLTCKVWSVDGGESVCFPLTTPGVAVSWHSEHPEKLLVAEKKGLLRFYNFVSQQPIMSLDCGHMPLISADWCHGNSLLVACLAGSDWFVFDTSRSSAPLENKAVHSEGGHRLRWSRTQRHLLATMGQPSAQVKIINVQSNQVLLSKEHIIASGLSWHYRLPLVVVGGDKKLHFYRIEAP